MTEHECDQPTWPKRVGEVWDCPECGKRWRGVKLADVPHVPAAFVEMAADELAWTSP